MAGRGRFPEEDLAVRLRKTLLTKSKDGTHWTCRALGADTRASTSTVQRVWQAFGLQPHRQQHFTRSTDPCFVEKVRDIVGLYWRPPDQAVVWCADQKSQIQALERTQALLPLGLGYWKPPSWVISKAARRALVETPMNRTRPTQLLIAVTFLASACRSATGADGGFESVDSAGVTLALNSAGKDRPTPWRLTELRRLGGADSGPQAFDNVSRRTAAVDPHDRIHVLTDDNRVEVFDSLGNHLRSLGRKGGGPGEIELAGGLSIASDGSVFVLDYLKHALVAFDTAGNVLPQVSFETLGFPYGGLERDGDITVIDERLYGDSSARRLRYITSSDTAVLVSIPVIAGGDVFFKKCGVGLRGQAKVFDPGLEWSMFRGMVGVARTDSYEVRLSERGRPIRFVRRDIVPTAATAADVARRYPEGIPFQVGNRKCPVPAKEWAEQLGVAEHLPVVAGIRLGPPGTLWVVRFTFPDEPPLVDVFDQRGKYMGTLRNLSLPVGFLSGGRVTAAVDDPSSGGQRLAIYALEPAPWP